MVKQDLKMGGGGLLLIDKTRVKGNTYRWVSV
jgi:hypothetical protein